MRKELFAGIFVLSILGFIGYEIYINLAPGITQITQSLGIGNFTQIINTYKP